MHTLYSTIWEYSDRIMLQKNYILSTKKNVQNEVIPGLYLTLNITVYVKKYHVKNITKVYNLQSEHGGGIFTFLGHSYTIVVFLIFQEFKSFFLWCNHSLFLPLLDRIWKLLRIQLSVMIILRWIEIYVYHILLSLRGAYHMLLQAELNIAPVWLYHSL